MTLALLLMLAPCLAAGAQPVTLAEAVRGAVERDPSFVIQRAEADRSLADAEQAERAYLARLSLRSTGARYSTSVFADWYTLTSTASVVLPAAGGSTVSVDARDSSFYVDSRNPDAQMYSHDPQVGVTLRKPLVGGAASSALTRDARARPGALRLGALASLDEARNDAVLGAATLFFTVAEQRKRIALAQARLAERKKDLENLARSSSLRLGGRREVEKERLAIREDEIGIAALRSVLGRLEPQLGWLLGRPPGEPDDTIPAPLPARQPEDLRTRALASSGRVRRAAADLAAKRAEAALAVVTDAPAVTVSATLDGDYETTDVVRRPIERALTELRPKLTVSLLFDLPFGRARDRELARGRADAQVLEAAVERDRVEDEVSAAVADLVAERLRLAELVDVRGEQAALAREDLRTQTELRASGQATAGDVTLARLEVDDRELSAWRARADLFLADLRARALEGEDLARVLLTGSRSAAGAAP